MKIFFLTYKNTKGKVSQTSFTLKKVSEAKSLFFLIFASVALQVLTTQPAAAQTSRYSEVASSKSIIDKSNVAFCAELLIDQEEQNEDPLTKKIGDFCAQVLFKACGDYGEARASKAILNGRSNQGPLVKRGTKAPTIAREQSASCSRVVQVARFDTSHLPGATERIPLEDGFNSGDQFAIALGLDTVGVLACKDAQGYKIRSTGSYVDTGTTLQRSKNLALIKTSKHSLLHRHNDEKHTECFFRTGLGLKDIIRIQAENIAVGGVAKYPYVDDYGQDWGFLVTDTRKKNAQYDGPRLKTFQQFQEAQAQNAEDWRLYMVTAEPEVGEKGKIFYQDVTGLVSTDEEKQTARYDYRRDGARPTFIYSEKGNSGGPLYAFNKKSGEIWDIGTNSTTTPEADMSPGAKASYPLGIFNIISENQRNQRAVAGKLLSK